MPQCLAAIPSQQQRGTATLKEVLCYPDQWRWQVCYTALSLGLPSLLTSNVCAAYTAWWVFKWLSTTACREQHLLVRAYKGGRVRKLAAKQVNEYKNALSGLPSVILIVFKIREDTLRSLHATMREYSYR